MRHIVAGALCLAVMGAFVAGCGGGSQESTNATATSSPSASSTAGGATLPPGLDDGPRASAEPIDESKAEAGEKLFQTKGCSACHGFGKRVSCPDLLPVPAQRTSKWMASQILHPDIMTKQDPIARQLFAEFTMQMPNQGLTEDEARAVIEFLKHKNHEAGEHSATK
jgi:mono/diheme cytochrome c family protein